MELAKKLAYMTAIANSAVEGEMPPVRVSPEERARRNRERKQCPKLAIADRDKWICGLCEARIQRRYEHPDIRALQLDHIRTKWRGGSDDPANLRATHGTCNNMRNGEQRCYTRQQYQENLAHRTELFLGRKLAAEDAVEYAEYVTIEDPLVS